MLAVHEQGGLRWAGNVGTGFTEDEIDELLARLKPLAAARLTARGRAEDAARPQERRRLGRAELVVEVEFAEWTHDGHLRSPSFLGVREDKLPEEVRREEPFPTEHPEGQAHAKFSNLDKVFWPEEGITKGDLLAYYREIAPVLLPHLHDRPFTMKRYPGRLNGKFFFQKDAPKHMPEWIPTRRFESRRASSPRAARLIDAPLVNDELALLWMVNMACIDMNTWYSRVDKPDRPGLGALRPRSVAGRRLPRGRWRSRCS